VPEWLHGPYLGGAGWLLRRAFDELLHAPTGPGPPALLRALSVCQTKPVLYGAFVWARGALNGRKRRFPAWAVAAGGGDSYHRSEASEESSDYRANEEASEGSYYSSEEPDHTSEGSGLGSESGHSEGCYPIGDIHRAVFSGEGSALGSGVPVVELCALAVGEGVHSPGR
jgi:hypothetical protein